MQLSKMIFGRLFAVFGIGLFVLCLLSSSPEQNLSCDASQFTARQSKSYVAIHNGIIGMMSEHTIFSGQAINIPTEEELETLRKAPRTTSNITDVKLKVNGTEIDIGDIKAELANSPGTLMQGEFKPAAGLEYLCNSVKFHWIQIITHDDCPAKFEGSAPGTPVVDPPNEGWDYFYPGGDRTKPPLSNRTVDLTKDGEPWYFNGSGDAQFSSECQSYKIVDKPKRCSGPNEKTTWKTWLVAEPMPNPGMEFCLIAGYEWSLINNPTSNSGPTDLGAPNAAAATEVENALTKGKIALGSDSKTKWDAKHDCDIKCNTVKDKIKENENLTFYWSKDNDMMNVEWTYEYKVEGGDWVRETVTGKLDFWKAHPELKGKKVRFRFFPPDGATDWHQDIIHPDGKSSVYSGNVKSSSPWCFEELETLPCTYWRIPDIAPAGGGDTSLTVYTAVNLDLYFSSNPVGFLDGEWNPDQTLSSLGLEIVDGQMEGVDGIYWSTTPFEFDPLSAYGFVPSGGESNLLSSSTFPAGLLIIEEHTNAFPDEYEEEEIKPDGVYITEPDTVLQGTHQTVDLIFDGGFRELGGFDFLIGYDASALTFTSAEEGDIYLDYGWEYFTYRVGPSGNCDNGCPTGIIRLIGLAEINNGAYHPNNYTLIFDDVFATLDFLVSNDRTLECQFVPIRFFWMDCGDNSISGADGDSLFISHRVYDYSGSGTEGPDGNRRDLTDTLAAFPAFFGAPSVCLNPDPDKPSALRRVNFFNGGIRIACAEDIDLPGDVNLNGVAYEIADAVAFTNYFVHGLAAFDINVPGQIAATDVNKDGLVLTVADLVYMIRVIIGAAQPDPKLAPTDQTASVNVHVNHRVTTVSTSSETDIGGAYFVFEHSGYDIGEPQLINGASEMSLKYLNENGLLKVLVYSMEEGKKIAAGRENIFIIPVEGNGAIDLKEIQLSDCFGTVLTSKAEDEPILPKKFTLHQNYPNPFNAATQIVYELPKSAPVKLEIVNITGRKVVTLVDDMQSAGVHRVEWNGLDQSGNEVASGIYFYRLETEDFTETRKMSLIK